MHVSYSRVRTQLRSFCILSFLFGLQVTGALVSTHSSESDPNLVEQQLGYLPPNFLCVSARTSNDSPIAIQTYPLHGGAPRRQAKATATPTPALLGTPFPTLYWLTGPEISRAIGGLERKGYIVEFEKKLNSDPLEAARFISSHKQYARARWNSLKEEDRTLLTMDHSSVKRMRNMLECSGVAGTDFLSQQQEDGSFVASVKCLHAHYAHYRSTSPDEEVYNPVGLWIHKTLQEEFPDVIL
mmetsp:Transcript_22106/g.30759  ORF Transcript_22106/g.30759 Transcript_22106/m.30759 type:complete len:241 (-) Transcript_22106:229-951(-)